MTNAVRNIKAFVTAYLKSDSGTNALTRMSYRDKRTQEYVQRSPAMAFAFAKALGADLDTSKPVAFSPKAIRASRKAQPASIFVDDEGKKQDVPDFTKGKRR